MGEKSSNCEDAGERKKSPEEKVAESYGEMSAKKTLNIKWQDPGTTVAYLAKKRCETGIL